MDTSRSHTDPMAAGEKGEAINFFLVGSHRSSAGTSHVAFLLPRALPAPAKSSSTKSERTPNNPQHCETKHESNVFYSDLLQSDPKQCPDVKPLHLLSFTGKIPQSVTVSGARTSGWSGPVRPELSGGCARKSGTRSLMNGACLDSRLSPKPSWHNPSDHLCSERRRRKRETRRLDDSTTAQRQR